MLIKPEKEPFPKIQSGFSNLWPTTVYQGNIENKELVEEVVNDSLFMFDFDKPPSDLVENTNVLFASESLIKFKDRVVLPSFNHYLQHKWNVSLDDFEEYNLKSWYTGAKKGYDIQYHNHSGAQLSSIFYLLIEGNHGGELLLADPRTNANRGYFGKMFEDFSMKAFTPMSCTFIIFPSFLYHFTDMFEGTIRLGIPVDLFLGNFKS